MKSKGMKAAMALLAVLVVVPGSSWAFGGHRGDGPKGPPQEAIDICKDKAAGTAVEFTTRHGDKVQATCRMMAVPEFAEDEGENYNKHVERLAKALDLSSDQKTKITALLKAAHEKNAPIREQLQQNREELRTAAHALPFDEAAVRSIASKLTQNETEMIVSRAKVMSEINALLTPEQRTRAEKLRPSMGHRHMHQPEN